MTTPMRTTPPMPATSAARAGDPVPRPQEVLDRAIKAPRVVIDRLQPCVDDGRFPAKGTLHQPLSFEADVFSDGHEVLAAELVLRAPGEEGARRITMRALGNDRFAARVVPTRCGRHLFTVEAWVDAWASYRRGLSRLHEANKVGPQDLAEGLERINAAARVDRDGAARSLVERLAGRPREEVIALLLDDGVAELMSARLSRGFPTRHPYELCVDVERERAGFASWYELFPRSTGAPGRHGTFDDVVSRLPGIAAMGFDVLYMTPIHPIGTTKRKGRNNSLVAASGDPGSPYAIGAAEGGHDAVHPDLGGIAALRRLRDAAAGYGIELALDLAIQCSPDHPWLREHPEWFSWRSDGSVKCAENPPKKYEDIVNVEFYAAGALPSLWLAWRDVLERWIVEGIRTFRVDNPHTKPLPFWQWLIADIRSRHPDVIFLSEAFTRPAMMYRLAKIGFAQSYTYFTWRNHKAELAEYMQQLTQEAPRDFFRPHFFVNTPDINPPFLQTSGRPGFLIRAALAATLSGLWGLYSGFELCESAPLPGREEYLDSEKYEVRHRDWTAPGNIVAEISRLNRLRRENRALQSHLYYRAVHSDNDRILVYAKQVPCDDVLILVAVSLDPHEAQESWFDLPFDALSVGEGGAIEAEELMSGRRFVWHDRRQHWRFVPQEMPFALWKLRRAGGVAA
ncbi:MAG: alpha-1,4-glucan--maltose-1-phosphate maltosyltransferase [Panacagrimonas sp.]